MNRYICPVCQSKNFCKKDIWLHTLLANKITCSQCEEKLRLKINGFKRLMNMLIMHLLLFLSLFVGYYFQSYFASGLCIMLAIIIDSLVYQTGKLSQYGFK